MYKIEKNRLAVKKTFHKECFQLLISVCWIILIKLMEAPYSADPISRNPQILKRTILFRLV